MTTHGNVLVIDRGDARSEGIWLHAFSDGHVCELVEMLKSLHVWFVQRAVLAKRLGDGSVGKRWYLRAFDESEWAFFSANLEAHKSFIAGLLVSRYLDRWVPMQEADAPWHDVGDDPSVTVVCDVSTFEIVVHEPDDEIEGGTVAWIDCLMREFMSVNNRDLGTENTPSKLWDLLHEVAPLVPVANVDLHERVQAALDRGA